MSDDPSQVDSFAELRAIAAAAEVLAKEADAFAEAFEASQTGDAGRFQAVLDRVGIGHECDRICFLFCQKRCIGRCIRLCPDPLTRPVDAAEVRDFIQAFAPITRRPRDLAKLAAAADAGDPDVWHAELERFRLGNFCHQVCHFLCRERCREVCRELCSRPLITRISSMVAPDNFNALGFGVGPSIPPNQVPPPPPSPPNAPPTDAGNHPIGGSSELRGYINFPAATQYKVEVATALGGPFAPILDDVWGWNLPNPPLIWKKRSPTLGADPGWFNIFNVHPVDPPDDPFNRGIFFSDGGPNPFGEKTLVNWSTGSVPDGVNYLRLLARDAAGTVRVSSPQKVHVDNTPPVTPVIHLQLQKPTGELKDLICGEVKKGDGLIRITIQATDPNFSACGVAAQGNSSLSVPIVAVPDPPGIGPAVPLSKVYNFNVADTGYPVPTSFLWDPWNDPLIVQCCYVIRIDIRDRAVINNSWQGGHGGSGWEAIEIGF